MKLRYLVISFLSVLIFASPLPTQALDIEKDAVFVRVIDTGPGLACVVRMPGDFYMVYDAGHWHQDKLVAREIPKVIPEDEDIDLMVLSHTDADHLAAVDEIFEKYTVKEVMRLGLVRDTRTWEKADLAIKAASSRGDTFDLNLRDFIFQPGEAWSFGQTKMTMVSGFHKPPSDWDIQGDSEKLNAGSIVIRLEFKGKSILFTGDAVGRHIGDDPDEIIASEKFMVDNKGTTPIDSDVLIAPHHGADNGSSTKFIKAVSPTWVIFSAGHDHKHPTASAAKRYLDNGVAKDHMLRTDLGDDEGSIEWKHGRKNGHTDKAGDDDVDILIRSNGEIVVEYR